MTSPPAAKTITRRTTIKQILDISIDLGAIDPASQLQKTRVIRKRDGVEMFVNTDDFGIDEVNRITGKIEKAYKWSPKHYAIVENYDPDILAAYVEPDKVISLYTLDDLATMRISELREVPEYLRISLADRRNLRSKQDYVDAILAQREPSVVAEPASRRPSAREAIGE